MGEISDFQVGQTVELQDGKTAIVHFVGQTRFALGGWVGVVLEEATGKNDGAVQGQRYFDCPPDHGMFVRPSAIKILDYPTPKANGRVQTKIQGDGAAKRQSVVPGRLRRESVKDATGGRRQSINAGSPTPGLRGSNGSPNKSPTKQLGSTTSSGNSTPQSTISSTAHKPSLPGVRVARPSMGPPSIRSANVRPPRQSTVGPLNGLVKPTSTISASSRSSTNSLSMMPEIKPKLGSAGIDSQASVSSDHDSIAETPELEVLSPALTDVFGEINVDNPSQSQDSLSSLEKASMPPSLPRPQTQQSLSQRPSTANSATNRDIEDYKTKIRVLEKKRSEDREKLKELGRVQSERDRYEGIIQKLQSKYQPHQQEMAELRKHLKDTDAKIERLEKEQAENDTVVEVATLDREMAEETAESLKNELDVLKQGYEELKMEVEVLREENQELGKEMSPEEKTSQGWLQMERSNERLREALVRLRDVTQEQEADLREEIAGLEAELHGLEGTREQQMRTQLALTESESTVTELRQQLDVAVGAEDMIEELTEKNLAFNDQVENLRATVEELESLKELNDELEINHTENAKQMQEEIDYTHSLLAEQARNATIQGQTIQDLEYTVTKFRDLVKSMQIDLEEMRTSQQLTEAEANDLSSRSRAMMDLNMRLQTSASKAQVTAIELEMDKLEAQESAEHLSIIQHFLPTSFKDERNSIAAYLRIKRIRFKADLLHGHVKEKATAQPATGRDNDVFTACDVMDKLIGLSSTCDRFVRSIQSCDLTAFSQLEGAFFDLEPVERALNGWIEAVKRDELKEESCAAELSRSMSLMTHLAEVHINDSIERYADDIHTRALIMQAQIESTLVALSHIKATAGAKTSPSSTEEEDEDVDAQEFNRKSDLVISQTRSAKVIIGKALRQLDDMQSRSLNLEQSSLPSIEQSQASVADLSVTTLSFGRSITKLLTDDTRSIPLTSHELSSAMATCEISFSSLAHKVQSATSHLQAFNNLTASLNHTVELTAPPQPPPWQLLAQKLTSETVTLAFHELEISRLHDESREKSTALALRDKSVEEINVRLETFEKRASESGGRRERVRELENVVEAAKQREIELINTVNRLRAERNDLRSQRETWVSKSGDAQGTSSSAGVPAGLKETTSEASLARIASLEAEIKTLEAAVRHLRATSYAHTISSAHDFLGKPLIPQPSLQEQRARLEQSEAKSVVSELLRLASDPANGVPRLRARKTEARLKWRPVRETCWWQVGNAKEEWEEWRQWRDDVGGLQKRRRDNRTQLERGKSVGAKKVSEQVKIVDIDGQEDVHDIAVE
ncbi:MAG: hypothetical protein Q9224_002837 [Gallowayella concinna]